MKDNSDLLERLNQDQSRKQNFINDLKKQIREDELRKLNDQNEDWELSRNMRNILINDERRYDEYMAKRNYYKDRLLNQMDENQRKRMMQNDFKNQEDADYKMQMHENLIRENERLRDLNNQKRKIFLDDIQRQLEEKEKHRIMRKGLDDMEDENVRRKKEMEEDDYRQKMFKKKVQMQEYLDDILGQQDANKLKKEQDNREKKMKTNTGMHLPERHEPCYNCARCRRMYPLRNLNKRKRRIVL